MLKLNDFSLSFGRKQVLSNLSFSLAKGKNLAVIGRNGSGKSSLALALARVIPDFVPASISGSFCCIKPMLVMQNPSSQFFAMTVEEELGPKGIALAKKFSLEKLLERNVFQLSEGEKQKINLVSGLLSKPETILLDEPLELLDPVEAARFKSLLLKAAKKALVWLDKSNPSLPNSQTLVLGRQEKPLFPKTKTHAREKVALKADFSLERNGFSLQGNFSLHDGEKIALIGLNGSGKSLALKAIAGMEKFSGQISKQLGISFVPQNPSHLFFNETAEAELAEKENASKLGIQVLLKQNPSTLSKGQQKMLSIATISSKGIALLDEPTTWLDGFNKAAVYSFISESSQAMLIATHDKSLLQYCDRIFLIKGGEIGECSSTAANRFFQG